MLDVSPSARTLVLCATLILASAPLSRAADPGLIIPATSEASDQKSGSVLIYNLFTSGATPASQDTRITLTNNSATSAGFVRLFFVDGNTGFVSDNTVCLTAQQTTSFKASNVRPGQTGYMVAVAIDGVFGCPVAFNALSGQAEIKMGTGQRGTLPAISHAAQFNGVVPGCDGNSTTAVLALNGVAGGYNLASRVLQVPSISSPADSASSLLVLNRVGGNFTSSAATIGSLDGVLFDDAENASGFTTLISTPQLRTELSNTFPVTTPSFSTMIGAGRTGWLKLFSPNDVGLSGSVLYLSSTTTSSGNGNGNGNNNKTTVTTYPAGGINLRALTLSAATSLTVPVRAPTCF